MELPVTEPHIDMSKLALRKRWKVKLTGNAKNHPIVAYDTETYKGYARLIVCSDGKYMLIDKQEVSEDTFTRILQFLTRDKVRGHHAFFWNIDYDFFAMLKYAGEEFARRLYEEGEAVWGDYKISYIPKKMFSINRHRFTFDFFDLYQFYGTALETASQKYLGEGKLLDAVDRTQLNDNFQIWKEKEQAIIAYCKRDADLTQRLAVLLKDTLKHNIGFIPNKYISKAYITKQYFRKYTTIPVAKDFPAEVIKYALLGYFGGRFEVTWRGHIGNCVLLDINSSYPFAMTQLKAYPKDAWIRSDQIKYEHTHGFYKIIVNTKDNAFITPFPFRYRGRVIFPKGEFITYATKEEILAYENECDIEILGGWEAKGEGEYFLKERVEYLYEWKKRAKGNDMEYMLVKILLNSLYGAFYEKQKRGDKYLTGILFSPPYATLITAIGRINLFKEALKYGKRIVGMATDSLLIKGQHNTPLSKDLGGWSFESEGDTYVLMSGIYKLGDKIRMRGIAVKRVGRIQTPHGEFEDIFEYIRTYPQLTEYIVTHEKPVKLGEVLTHTKLRTWEDLNVWHKVERVININKEDKREWSDNFANGGDFLSRSITSTPIDINALYDRMEGRKSERVEKERIFLRFAEEAGLA